MDLRLVIELASVSARHNQMEERVACGLTGVDSAIEVRIAQRVRQTADAPERASALLELLYGKSG